MKTVKTVDKNSKEYVFMHDIVCANHPEFRNYPDRQAWALNSPDSFNIPRLVEESLAVVGPYEFVDAAGYDFSDKSDSKTTTVRFSPSQKSAGHIEITNIETKIGDLRITAFNSRMNRVDFFWLPRHNVKQLKVPSSGKKAAFKEVIRFNYSIKKDNYGKFEKYRLGSFKELALAA